MTKEDIIRMAREAGAATGSPAPNAPEIIFPQCMDVERFAALVAAAAVASEREACAKVCDEYSAAELIDEFDLGWLSCAKNTAAAIRKRSSDLRARGQA